MAEQKRVAVPVVWQWPGPASIKQQEADRKESEWRRQKRVWGNMRHGACASCGHVVQDRRDMAVYHTLVGFSFRVCSKCDRQHDVIVVSMGARTEVKNDCLRGKTLVHYLVAFYHGRKCNKVDVDSVAQQVLQKPESKDAINVRDADGNTPLDIAVRQQYTHSVSLLLRFWPRHDIQVSTYQSAMLHAMCLPNGPLCLQNGPLLQQIWEHSDADRRLLTRGICIDRVPHAKRKSVPMLARLLLLGAYTIVGHETPLLQGHESRSNVVFRRTQMLADDILQQWVCQYLNRNVLNLVFEYGLDIFVLEDKPRH